MKIQGIQRNLVLEQAIFDQSPLLHTTQPGFDDPAETKEGILVSLTQIMKRENYIFKIIILNHMRSRYNPRDKGRSASRG